MRDESSKSSNDPIQSDVNENNKIKPHGESNGNTIQSPDGNIADVSEEDPRRSYISSTQVDMEENYNPSKDTSGQSVVTPSRFEVSEIKILPPLTQSINFSLLDDDDDSDLFLVDPFEPKKMSDESLMEPEIPDVVTPELCVTPGTSAATDKTHHISTIDNEGHAEDESNNVIHEGEKMEPSDTTVENSAIPGQILSAATNSHSDGTEWSKGTALGSIEVYY